MSLRQKFFVILAMLAIILGANVALSIWSIRFLERELAWPLRSAQPVLEESDAPDAQVSSRRAIWASTGS